MENALYIFQKGILFSLYQKHQETFLYSLSWELDGAPGSYLWKCRIHIKIRYSRVFILNLICIHPPAICQNDCWSFPTSWWLQKYLIHIGWNLAVFLHFNWESLYLPVFPDFRVVFCPDFNFLMNLRKVIYFQFVSFPLVLRVRVTIFKLFTSWNWSLMLPLAFRAFLLEMN